MGTPDFAVGSLEALLAAGFEVVGVVTQPDKAKGRSGSLAPSPVKECALRHGIEVFQPRRVKEPQAVERLRAFQADLIVVAAFGQILSQEILDLPKWGCLCVHASLLPKHRGASPIQHAILDGDGETGITIMQMDAGIDTGDILYQKKVSIDGTDTAQSLEDKLMALGGEAIVEAIPLLEAGKLSPRKQDGTGSYCPLIKKEAGKIDFSQDASFLGRLVRAMTPWPSAYTFYHGKQLKVWEAQPLEDGAQDGAQAGEILSVSRDDFVVAAGSGSLRILSVQLEGKKRMSAHDFLLGMKLAPGERLGL